MVRSTFEEFEARSVASRRLLRQEQLILEVTETLAAALEDECVSQKELATRLGRSKSFVSQVLGGGRNLTLRTISDIAEALDYRPHFRAYCRKEVQRGVLIGPWKSASSLRSAESLRCRASPRLNRWKKPHERRHSIPAA